MFETSQKQKRSSFPFQRELDEISCEYENMRRNSTLSKYREEDEISELKTKLKPLAKTVSWADNLLKSETENPFSEMSMFFSYGEKLFYEGTFSEYFPTYDSESVTRREYVKSEITIGQSG